VVEAEGLEYRYPKSSVKALKGLSFSIARGEIFGFLGPSGAGKSTTLKVLTGLLPSYGGDARVLGLEPGALKGRARASFLARLGVAFELPYLYERFTARENLEFFGAFYDGYGPARAEGYGITMRPGGIEALLERLGLAHAIDARVETLSKGMKMRLNLARALLHGPELLFLDEPTSGLDPATAAQVMGLIEEERAAGRAIFLTTHQMGVAERLCGRVGFMVDGRLELVDSPRALMLANGTRQLRVEWRDGGAVASKDFPLDGLHANAEFLALLKSGKVETMHSREASLEDIFIKTTGRGLE
jgi:fluoroquinolone transport system ATP-binding protein